MNSIKLLNRMDTIFMNSENGKTSDLNRLLLNLPDKTYLKRSDKYVALSNFSIYNTWKNIKKSYRNNKFKISTPTWNEKFELPGGSNSVSNIQDYSKYNFKKYETATDNPSIMIYVQGHREGTSSVAFEGINNELRNRFYKFVHLQLFSVKYNFVHLVQLFNVKHKFVHLQLFDVKFLFSEKHIFRKQKRTGVYLRASVFLDFKLTRENDDLLSSRHK